MRWEIREADSSNTGAIIRGVFANGFKGAGGPIGFRRLRRMVAGQRRFASGERARAPGRRRRCHFAVHAPAASRTHS